MQKYKNKARGKSQLLDWGNDVRDCSPKKAVRRMQKATARQQIKKETKRELCNLFAQASV
jgi:hypothetical protein